MKDNVLKRQSLKDQIKDILVDRIVSGELEPGDRIKELQIAKDLGTSQAPVREAIRCLETLGYVEHIPHVGAMVRTFHRQEIEEAYQIREALETYAVSLISGGREQLLKELEGCLVEMKRAAESNDINKFSRADNQFHRLIVGYSRNQTMISFWESLKMQLHVVATVVDASIPLPKIYDLHPPIVDSLREVQLPEASMHLTTHYEVIKGHWKNQGEK